MPRPKPTAWDANTPQTDESGLRRRSHIADLSAARAAGFAHSVGPGTLGTVECPACHCEQPDLEGARFCAICGTLLPRYGEVDPLVGRLIGGRFLIKNLIAIGGMGRVYGAEQQMGTTLRRLAVKVLLADYTVNPDVVSRFMRECSTVSELEHPNTIKFFDFGQTDDGHLYIAMEYVPGPSLATVMRNEAPLPADRVDRIIGQICGSLQEAHDKGFVHRDLKPENILLATHSGEEDFVKVLDFGIAKRAGANVPKITQEGMVLGSPPYMSPEQFSRGDLDARSDIYSLGVVTYKALTGQKPFRADKPVEWATEHMTAVPLPFDATPAGAAVPPNMKRAVMRALAKKPSDRPQTMREFYGELTLGNVRSSLLGRSMLPSAPDLGRLTPPPPLGSDIPPPAPLPAVAAVSPALGSTPAPIPATHAPEPARTSGGTIVLESGATTLQGPEPMRSGGAAPNGVLLAGAAAVRSDPPPAVLPVGPAPTRVDRSEASWRSLDRGEVVPPTMREPVPPTMREPGKKSRVALVASSIAGVLLLGTAAVLLVWLFTGGSTQKPALPAGTAATATVPAPTATAPPTGVVPPATARPTAPTATAPVPPVVPTAQAVPPPAGDACRLTIHYALADQCNDALRFRKLCPDTHPNHRDAHVTFDLHCKQ
jgi:serine/threonine-protein kinase